MNMRSINDPYGSFTPGTDKRIGDAFPIIEAVYSKLAELTYLVDNIPSLVPKQIEFRYVSDMRTLEWKYSDEVAWNVLVALESTVTEAAPATGLVHATGVPNNNSANADGSFYFRQDGGTGTSIYMKRSGVWVALI